MVSQWTYAELCCCNTVWVSLLSGRQFGTWGRIDLFWFLRLEKKQAEIVHISCFKKRTSCLVRRISSCKNILRKIKEENTFSALGCSTVCTHICKSFCILQSCWKVLVIMGLRSHSSNESNHNSNQTDKGMYRSTPGLLPLKDFPSWLFIFLKLATRIHIF